MKYFFTILIATLFTNVANAQSFNVGDNVQSTATLNIRSTLNGTLVGQHFSGDKGTIIGGPTYSAVSGYSGWVVSGAMAIVAYSRLGYSGLPAKSGSSTCHI